MLSINSRGEAIALWTDSHRGSAVLAATSEDGLHFSTPHRLSVSGGGIRGCATGERGLLATGPHGEAIAGWSCERGGASVQELARFVP
jgi:hypothetical protein